MQAFIIAEKYKKVQKDKIIQYTMKTSETIFLQKTKVAKVKTDDNIVIKLFK